MEAGVEREGCHQAEGTAAARIAPAGFASLSLSVLPWLAGDFTALRSLGLWNL